TISVTDADLLKIKSIAFASADQDKDKIVVANTGLVSLKAGYIPPKDTVVLVDVTVTYTIDGDATEKTAVYQQSITLKKRAIDVTGITYPEDKLTFPNDREFSFSLKGVIEPYNATNKNIIYEIDNTQLVRFDDQEGTVTSDKAVNAWSIGSGSTLLHMKTQDGNFIKTITIDVLDLSQTPTATTPTVAKTSATQKSVSFTLDNAISGTWQAYASQTAAKPLANVNVKADGLSLTLETQEVIAAQEYYVAVTQAGKYESKRLKLTVNPITVAPVVPSEEQRKDNTVVLDASSGVGANNTVVAGQAFSFTVTGYNQDGSLSEEGSIKEIPYSWSVNPSGFFGAPPYVVSVVLSNPGAHTLKVTYKQFQVIEGNWVATGGMDTKEIAINVDAAPTNPTPTPTPTPTPEAKPAKKPAENTANKIVTEVELEKKFENATGTEVSVDVQAKPLVSPEAFDMLYQNPGKELVMQGKGYQWTFNGKDITNPDAVNGESFDTRISFETPNKDEVDKASGGADVINIYFAHHGELPGKATVSIHLGKKEAGKTKKLYYYNQENKQMEFLGEYKVDENGNVQFEITHCSDYVLTDTAIAGAVDLTAQNPQTEPEKPTETKPESKPEAKPESTVENPKAETANSPILVIVLVAAVLLIGAIVIIIVKRKKADK
ncbi:MAG: hypothetical protein RR087_00840, partial [Oscillospiraceae bacterium]